MYFINSFLNLAFEIIWYPFKNTPSFLGITVISLLVGVFASLVYRFTANQAAIKKINNRIKAHIFELRLFDFDPALILKSLGGIFKNFFIYLFYSIKPIIFLIIPVIIILIQLHYLYDFSPLNPGDNTVVTISFKENTDIDKHKIYIKVPRNVKIVSPTVKIPEKNEISWEIQVENYGNSELSFRIDNEIFNKEVIAVKGMRKIVPKSVTGDFFLKLKYICSEYLPENQLVKSIAIKYPESSVSIFGLGIHWIIIFLIFTLISGMIIMKIYGIEW